MITKAGIYQIPAAQYHADMLFDRPSLSNSISKILAAETPRHAWTAHPRLNPNHKEIEKTSFDRGSAAHALLLEGEDRMTVIHQDSYRTNLAKELRDAARAQGKHPILEKDYDPIYEMVSVAKDAIRNCQDLGGLTLQDGNAEQVFAWIEGDTCMRSRIDWMSNDRRLILDFKTTEASANPADWERTMLNGWGDLQPAFNLRGNIATGGPEDAKFVWLVQEVQPPFACCFIGVTNELLALGQQKVNAAMEIWRECMASNKWPAYPARIHWLSPPAWAEAKWAERTGGYGPLDKDGLPETGLIPGTGKVDYDIAGQP